MAVAFLVRVVRGEWQRNNVLTPVCAEYRHHHHLLLSLSSVSDRLTHAIIDDPADRTSEHHQRKGAVLSK